MENKQLLDQNETHTGSPINGLALLLWAAVTVLVAVLAFLLGSRQPLGPGESSVEVGFTRDMVIHHAQAVDMATLLRDRSEDPELRQIALDMMLTQQAQIGQMEGWLNAWGYPLASTTPAMTWMGMPTSGLMPGMATPEQLNQLRDLSGEEADRHFLRLMIIHHRSGVEMAQAIMDMSDEPAVRALAGSIVASQSSEIEMMESLLAQKGGPLPGSGGLDPSMGTH